MLHIIFIKCKVDVMYFIFIFISPSVPRFSVKKSVNQLIKNKRPKPTSQEKATSQEACKPLHRTMQFHWKLHSSLQSSTSRENVTSLEMG